MQEEANQKTVGIAVQGTKMTGRAFLRACEKYLQYRKEQKRLKQQRREPDPASYEINQPKRVRVDRLLREGEGVSTVTIKDRRVGKWYEVLEEYAEYGDTYFNEKDIASQVFKGFFEIFEKYGLRAEPGFAWSLTAYRE